jgi:hypothetical protein
MYCSSYNSYYKKDKIGKGVKKGALIHWWYSHLEKSIEVPQNKKHKVIQ